MLLAIASPKPALHNLLSSRPLLFPDGSAHTFPLVLVPKRLAKILKTNMLVKGFAGLEGIDTNPLNSGGRKILKTRSPRLVPGEGLGLSRVFRF